MISNIWVGFGIGLALIIAFIYVYVSNVNYDDKIKRYKGWMNSKA